MWGCANRDQGPITSRRGSLPPKARRRLPSGLFARPADIPGMGTDPGSRCATQRGDGLGAFFWDFGQRARDQLQRRTSGRRVASRAVRVRWSVQEGYSPLQGGAARGSGPERERSAVGLGSCREVGESSAATGPVVVRWRSVAVVVHREQEVVGGVDRDLDAVRTGVAHDVGERLAQDRE